MDSKDESSTCSTQQRSAVHLTAKTCIDDHDGAGEGGLLCPFHFPARLLDRHFQQSDSAHFALVADAEHCVVRLMHEVDEGWHGLIPL